MRILDRGTTSIQDTVSIVLFNVLPQVGGAIQNLYAGWIFRHPVGPVER